MQYAGNQTEPLTATKTSMVTTTTTVMMMVIITMMIKT